MYGVHLCDCKAIHGDFLLHTPVKGSVGNSGTTTTNNNNTGEPVQTEAPRLDFTRCEDCVLVGLRRKRRKEGGKNAGGEGGVELSERGEVKTNDSIIRTLF